MPTRPQSIAVVGAGVVGLSTAWHLQRRGVEVTVLDRGEPGAGASWGNAGWLSPGLSTPLPEPAMLRFGLRAMLRPDSPLDVALVPPSASLAAFLLGLARHSTKRRWATAMGSLLPLNQGATAAWQELAADAGLGSHLNAGRPILAAFDDAAGARAFEDELDHLRSLGQPLTWEPVTTAEARSLEPALTARVRSGALLHGQQFVDPRSLVPALARVVAERGGTIRSGCEVLGVEPDEWQQRVLTRTGPLTVDAVVLANGAALDTLARPHGVRRRVRAGRGYSFSLPADRLALSGPVYFPRQKVACTPIGARTRIAGTMEFAPAGAPLDPARIAGIKRNVGPLLAADLADDGEQWVGSRPCTVDGLPLVGATRAPGVWVNGGYGMWGMTLGPVVASVLAGRVVGEGDVPELRPLDPLR